MSRIDVPMAVPGREQAMTTETPGMRVDKWLWAARFFKTRSLATEALHAGHIRLNGQIPKPAREVRVGDMLDIALGTMRWTVIVRALNAFRRPAAEAMQLYEETGESLVRREAVRENLRLAPDNGLKGRPTKRDRRQIHRFNESY